MFKFLYYKLLNGIYISFYRILNIKIKNKMVKNEKNKI